MPLLACPGADLCQREIPSNPFILLPVFYFFSGAEPFWPPNHFGCPFFLTPLPVPPPRGRDWFGPGELALPRPVPLVRSDWQRSLAGILGRPRPIFPELQDAGSKPHWHKGKEMVPSAAPPHPPSLTGVFFLRLMIWEGSWPEAEFATCAHRDAWLNMGARRGSGAPGASVLPCPGERTSPALLGEWGGSSGGAGLASGFSKDTASGAALGF